jgi:hypothetical protein
MNGAAQKVGSCGRAEWGTGGAGTVETMWRVAGLSAALALLLAFALGQPVFKPEITLGDALTLGVAILAALFSAIPVAWRAYRWFYPFKARYLTVPFEVEQFQHKTQPTMRYQ